ncbi:MAG: xylose isomerase [Deltaproteobacteria bacterium]|nr:xylose isomerase [Deltaproteobacteria bacterium]
MLSFGLKSRHLNLGRIRLQHLDVYQSLWAMELRRPDGREWTTEERFEKISSAGYRGVSLDPMVEDIDHYRDFGPWMEKYDLACLMNIFPCSIEDMVPLLEFAKEMKAPFVNVIGLMYPLTVEGAIPIIREWLAISRDLKVPILFETHRECITNDMFFTLQLIDAIPEMRLCADLSHYVVNRELRIPISEENQALFDRLIGRSDCLQGRVANREQVQIPVTFKQHEEWVDLFRGWWKSNMRSWKERSGPDDRLAFLCELGPPPYGITGADGYEISDRWEEALMLKGWAEDIWNDLANEEA